MINANFGSGRLQLPKDQPGMVLFADSVFDAGALEKHSSDDLERILAGRTVGTSFGIGDEYLSLGGKTNQKDLLLELQLICAQMMAPGYREEGLRQLQLGMDALYTQVQHTPEGILKTQLDGLLHEGDARFHFPSKEELSARSIAELRAWLRESLKSSYLEISVIGDIDIEATVKAVSQTFGALPTRAASRPDYAAERKVPHAAAQQRSLTFESKIPKGVVAVFWPTTDRRKDIKQSRRLNILASILDDKVMEKVREELGESYSPDVHSMMSDTFDLDGNVIAYLICDGKTAAKIGDIVTSIGTAVAQSGVTADQLERARKPLLTMMDTQMRNNAWWLKTIVSEAQSNPTRLDWARTITDDYKAITTEEISALAKQYLVTEKATVVRIIPEASAAK
jgi:zinc protease